MLQQRTLPQHGVSGLGKGMALTLAEGLVVTEKGGNHAVSGEFELEHIAKQFAAHI